MDLIESPYFTTPIILLQTVMEEVRHRSLPLYNRLKALIKMEEKKIWIFYNEFRSYVKSPPFNSRNQCNFGRETAVVREEGESPNDRNDRGACSLSSGSPWLTQTYMQVFGRRPLGTIPISPLPDCLCEANRPPYSRRWYC